MVGLEVTDALQRLVDLIGRRLHLRQRRLVRVQRLDERRLVAHLQVHVHDLVRKRGELVAEAGGIDAGQLNGIGSDNVRKMERKHSKQIDLRQR